METNTLGERITLLRRQKKWSQKELAEKAGIYHSNISKYELDLSTPSVDVLKKLVNTLATSSDYLLFGKTNK